MGWFKKLKNEELLIACKKGNIRPVKKLLSRGASVEAKDSYGFTALLAAAWYGHQKICKLLIENGADVNATDKYGFTVLHRAIYNNHHQICELLIENGADVYATDKYGHTTLQAAATGGHDQICALLIDKGVEVRPLITQVPKLLTARFIDKHPSAALRLLIHGAEFNHINTDELDETPFKKLIIDLQINHINANELKEPALKKLIFNLQRNYQSHPLEQIKPALFPSYIDILSKDNHDSLGKQLLPKKALRKELMHLYLAANRLQKADLDKTVPKIPKSVTANIRKLSSREKIKMVPKIPKSVTANIASLLLKQHSFFYYPKKELLLKLIDNALNQKIN